VEAQNGILYGTVPNGGNNAGGVLFRIGTDGSGFNVLHHFKATANDGSNPLGKLLIGSDGFLYGAVAGGGSNGFGGIFRIDLEGSNYAMLYHFAGADGKNPSAGVIEGLDGALYGTARKGSSADFGNVFRLNKDGTGFTMLRQFLGKAQNDGQEPIAELLQAADGNLYGTTYSGGTGDAGTIFKLNTNGLGYSVIYHGQHTVNNGAQPVAGLIQGANGFLYGTMPRGGISHGGVAFRISTQGGDFTVLRYFGVAEGDGAQPYSPLLLANDGLLYGTAFNGGDHVQNGASGVIFRLASATPPGRITSFGIMENGFGFLFKDGAAGRVYNIQRSSNLTAGSWTTIGSRVAKIDGTFEFSEGTPPGANSFFRTSAE
jgi:uncharacterized repeat protein (TIGR03803 family)